MTAIGFHIDRTNPLNFEFRSFKADRDMQAIVNGRLKSVSGDIDALLRLLADTQSKRKVPADEKLALCAGLWDQLPERRHILAAIALNALAEAFDADIARAEALKALIPNFSENEELERSFKKIRAISRAKQKYYFRTRYQARDVNRLKAQLFRSPGKPIPDGATFVCVGSCFATNIGTALVKRGVKNVYGIRYHDDADPVSILSGVMRDEVFKQEVVSATSCAVILTAGCAESVGTFLTPEQVSEVIIQMDTTLKKWNPETRFFVTVSPVPLRGTASGLSPYEANSISKAIIRLGVEQARKAGVEYYPSYELVTQHFNAIGLCPVGVEDGTPNHVNSDTVLFITDLFIERYLPHVDLSKPVPEKWTLPVRAIGPDVEEQNIEHNDSSAAP